MNEFNDSNMNFVDTDFIWLVTAYSELFQLNLLNKKKTIK